MANYTSSKNYDIPGIEKEEIARIANEINAYYDKINRLRERKLKRPSEDLSLKQASIEYSSLKSESCSERPPKKAQRSELYECYKIEKERIKKAKLENYSYSSSAIPPLPLDMTFTEKLIHLMNLRGVTNPDVYKAANLDKSLFSKLTSDKDYSPSKETAISISLALGLNLGETNDLLKRAGYTLSHSQLRDAAVEYCIKEKIFNVVKVNIILDELGCPPLSRVH